jgi:EAL domain-containing protein (putative c-di-GMP-specific phosphodiesterase class I)
MITPEEIDAALQVDEVGIETARYRDYLLKSAYQPIYRREGDELRPVAVEGLARPFREGAAIPPLRFFSTVPPQDRFFVESVCRALHLRNYRNLGVEGLGLFFNFDQTSQATIGRSLEQIAHMAKRLREIGFDPSLLVCEITETETLDRELLLGMTRAFRAIGARIAVDDFGAGYSTLDRILLVAPDFIKFDGAWFRQIAADGNALRLLAMLIEGLRSHGGEVLIEGIETPAQLAAALGAGADLVQGYLLARPALVGTDVDFGPLPLEQKITQKAKVVALFDERPTKHQLR